MQIVSTIFWRRIDAPGHDACRLERHGDAWRLDGAAVFRHGDSRIARLDYRVQCDAAWHTKWGRVHGWIGAEAVDVSLARGADGAWTLNEQEVPGLAHCTDLDLGFTPATNTISLRRMALAPGAFAEVTAAWFDMDKQTLSVLPQRYERETQSSAGYHYEAPRFDYAAQLRVTPDGFVADYPGLWLTER